jgi:hypothetical protein
VHTHIRTYTHTYIHHTAGYRARTELLNYRHGTCLGVLPGHVTSTHVPVQLYAGVPDRREPALAADKLRAY